MNREGFPTAAATGCETVWQLVCRRAYHAPGVAAVVAPGRTALCFAGLERHVIAQAAALNAEGIGRNDRVALVLPNGPEMATAFLAIASCATCAPLDPECTAESFECLLEDLQARALVVAAGGDPLARAAALRLGIRIIEVRAGAGAHAGEFALDGAGRRPARGAPDFAGADDTALVLYTSGTTGRPRQVRLTHANLCASARNIAASLQLTPADRCLNVLPLFHVHGLVAALLASLAAGGSVACTPGPGRGSFFEWLDELHPTWYTAVPAMHQAIVDGAGVHREAIRRNPLRFLRSASAALPVSLAAALERCFQAPVIEAYGMTEAAHQIASNRLPPALRKPGSVGVAAGPEVAVMDAAGRLLPAGAAGEIVIRGDNVTPGYANDPEANARAFAAGWFRTGDLGLVDAQGYIHLTGRLVETINRGGEKVSPHEVDAALLEHPAVRQAATFSMPHATLGEDVAAAVVLHPETTATAEDIRGFLFGRLPASRIPSRLALVEKIPTSPTGKIERARLADRLAAQLTGVVVAPRDAVEAQVAAIFSEALGSGEIGVEDNFFARGGDSLRGFQVLARIRTRLRVNLSIRDLFEEPTVAQIARRVVQAQLARPALAPEKVPGALERRCVTEDGTGTDEARASASMAPMAPLARSVALPASFAQQRLWFLDRLLPDKAAYNVFAAWRLRGPLDAPSLQRSLDAVAARHEALRTRFALEAGEPVQVIEAPQPAALPLTDLSALEPAAREARAHRLAHEHARRPFDLEAGPPLRARLLRLDVEEHLLLLTVHHIAADGWSMGIFDREVSAAYNAFVNGREPALPALPIQYADYALWQRRRSRVGALDTQLGYWKSRLAGMRALELPTDRPRPAVASHLGASLALDLPAPLCGALKALGRGMGATLFMTLLAAFQVLLHRLSGQDDVAVGTPVAGRSRCEFEGLIGCFVNTLVLRSDLGGNPRFREFLARVRESALGAFSNQELPFERLVEELAPARDMSRNPLVQVVFALRNAPAPALELEGIQATPLAPDSHSAKFDLSVSACESSAGLRTCWEYATGLFDAATVARLAGHFRVLLEAIAADPERRIGELPLLGPAERRRAVVEWNDTGAAYPRERCIHALVEEHAARTPGAVALECEDRRLTYGELNARANRLAHHLIALGVGPETVVGVCMERCLELAVALLGVLKAGGAYLPLDPNYPTQRLAYMLHDAQAPVLLTQLALLEQLPPYAGRIACLDRDAEVIAARPDTNPPCRATARNLAYVMYTSGSTGKPKGVAVPHRAVLRLVLAADYVQLDARQTFLLLSPVSFDASTFELWGALLHGARCAVFGERVPTVEALGETLRRHQVSILWLTASLFDVIIDEAPGILGGVRQLLIGGEALSPAHVCTALRRLPHVQLINGYGPTESTTFACCYRIPNLPAEVRSPVPIGRPISNTRAYVLDRHMSPAPVGVAGELWIGGDGLARGYLNRPELTAEKFVPDPFSAGPGARLYRTGDLARYLPDGNIEFLGRLDEQVKIRGFRIEPGEIEAVLAEHPAVRQAVVAARETAPGGKRLVAYVLPADGARGGIEPLRTWVRERLPEHMRPAEYVVLERLPLTPNGKIDRRALPAPQAGRDSAAGAFAAPRNVLERLITDSWCEVLKLERVGVHENFFDLGGHSLLAMKLAAILRARTGLELPVSMVFESPTPAALASRLRIEEPATDLDENESAGVPRVSITRTTKTCSAAPHAPPAIHDILGKQRDYVRTWKGKRAGHDSFIFTLNDAGRRQGLFWCLQGYREFTQLAKHLGPDQPLHGMRSGHLIMEYGDENVGAIAAHYAAEMIVLQPDGPFVVGGNCQGGKIARAIALRLRALGRTVALLILMEQVAFPAYDGPVALIFGYESCLNPYRPGADPETVFRSAYPAGYTVDIIAGAHGQFFGSPNVKTLAAAVERRLREKAGPGGRHETYEAMGPFTH